MTVEYEFLDLLVASFMKDQIPESFLKLSKMDQVRLLTQTTVRGSNALMVAVTKSKTAVENILKAMQSFTLEQRANILGQKRGAFDSLLLAMTVQPEVTSVLMSAIAQLEWGAQVRIIANAFGSSFFVEKMNPSNLRILIKAFESLNVEKTNIILNYESPYYNNWPLPLTRWEMIASSKLTPRSKYNLLKVETSYFTTPLPADTNAFRILWGENITNLLELLNPNEEPSDTPSPQMILYRSLKQDLDAYLKSPRKKDDLKSFHDAWNSKIAEALEDDELTNEVPVLNVLLLIISVVGLFYLAYQASKNYSQNRSLFFPSVLESKLITLQDKACEAVVKADQDETSTEQLILNL